METTQQASLKGGEFIIKPTGAQSVFTPADFTEEQNYMHQTCLDFVQTEVHPLLERLDNHEEGLMRGLMEKAGQLGLFGVSVPEQFGGLDMDFPTALRVTEGVG
ncbi:MAG: acyl-CoA dehydrogenase, partial [Hymenobacter sp.]|nr:acyl-CoA dehydrogenase [Hymenobacter sp.]